MILCILVMLLGYVSSFRPMEDPNLFEGDMILSPDQLRSIKNGIYNKNIPLAATKQPWPKLILYDLFGLKYKPVARKAIEDAFRDFHKYTCLRFIPRTTEDTYIRFQDAAGCSSSVGYVKGRINPVNLGIQCWTKGIAIHEILHSMGFHHEQSRPDRDQYVKVHLENVPTYALNNFVKYGRGKVDSLGEPYDFKSIMHYAHNTFAKPKKSAITTLDPSKQSLIGQRNGFSKLDIVQVNKLYKCSDGKPMTIPVIPTVDPSCSDKYAFCQRNKYRCNLPNTDSLKKWMVEQCRSTCGFCGTSPTKPVVTTKPLVTKRTTSTSPSKSCFDTLTSCDKNNCNISERMKRFMKTYCRKTCNHC